jgi:hypothetical protein
MHAERRVRTQAGAIQEMKKKKKKFSKKLKKKAGNIGTV